jgi:hypothetical protein
VAVHVHLADQHVEHVVGERGGDLEPYRRAEPAPGQLPLQGLQEVFVAVLVDSTSALRYLEMMLDDLHAGQLTGGPRSAPRPARNESPRAAVAETVVGTARPGLSPRRIEARC